MSTMCASAQQSRTGSVNVASTKLNAGVRPLWAPNSGIFGVSSGKDFVVLTVGTIAAFTGNVTTLNWIGARPPGDIEAGLGFAHGRLAQGYYILLLKDRLSAADFIFEGTTMRSGGRAGLPQATHAADAARPKVHDQIFAERGQSGYSQLQLAALRSTAYIGAMRIAKVLPVVGHDARMAPNAQYPMGGGGLQWRLVQPRNFLVACFVGPDLVANTTGFSVNLAETHGAQLYENRAQLMRYLEAA